MYKSAVDVMKQIDQFDQAFENYVNTSSASTSYLAKTPSNEFSSEKYKMLEDAEAKADTQLKMQAIELKEKARLLIREIKRKEKTECHE